MSSEWVTAVAIVGCLMLLAVVALDRNRTRRRFEDTLGTIAGLRHDVDAAQQRIAQLQSYLSRHESWKTDSVTPHGLTEPAPQPQVARATTAPSAARAGSGREESSTSTAGP